MVNRPIAYPRWATDVGALVTEPPEGPSGGAAVTKSDGWLPGNPPLDYDNWLKLQTYNWSAWLDQISFRTSDLSPNHALPGGTPPAIGAGLAILLNTFSASVYADGYRVSAGFGVSLVTGPTANYNYSATSDTYWDLTRAGVWVPVVVASGAGEPAVTANSTRVYAVRTNATDRTLLLADRRAERVRQNAPRDLTHGTAAPGGGSAVDRAVASFRWKYPDAGTLYTLLFETEDDGAQPCRGVRIYAKESTERLYVVHNARWNATSSQWDFDGGALTASRVALHGPSLDATEIDASVGSFVDSLWDAMPSGANGVSRGITQHGGTIRRTSATERFSLEDVPAFDADNTTTPSNIHRHYVCDFGRAKLYALQDDDQGTDYGGSVFGGLGLEIVNNALWVGDNTTGQHWDRIVAGEDVYKLSLDRRGLELHQHDALDGDTWDDELGVGLWRQVFNVTDLGANFLATNGLHADFMIPNIASAAIPVSHALYRNNVSKGWGVVTTDGVGGITLEAEFGVSSVAIIGGGVALQITLRRAMTTQFWAVSWGCAPGFATHAASSTTQKSVQFIDDTGTPINLSTQATRIEFSVDGIHS